MKTQTLGTMLMMTIPACAVAAPVDVTRGAVLKLEASAAAGGDSVVRLHGVSASGGELPIYEVFLRDARGHRARLGLISFFNETAPGAPGSGMREFPARAALAALQGPAAAVELKPISGVADGPVRIAPGVRVSVARAEMVQR